MFFRKKRCKNCGGVIKESWLYCPNCGIELKRKIEKPVRDFFDFEDFEKEFEKIGKTFGFRFTSPKMSFKPVRGGIRVVVVNPRGPSVKPRGIKEEEEPVRIPKIILEPETKIEKVDNKQIINVKLPGVESKDIEVKRLEQSIEIKAFAGDTAYFKLIPIPSNASINKEFNKDILKIEVQR